MSVAEQGVPLHAAALRRLGVVSIGDLIDRALGTTADAEDIDEAERAEAVEQILTVVAAATPPGWDLIDRALGTTADAEDIDEAERAEAVEQILTVVAAATPPGWDQAEWNGLMASLTRQIVTARDEVPRFPRRAAGCRANPAAGRLPRCRRVRPPRAGVRGWR